MKSEYICETCGRRSHTPEEATAVIGEMIEKHIKTFKEFPEVKISDEATELIMTLEQCHGWNQTRGLKLPCSCLPN